MQTGKQAIHFVEEAHHRMVGAAVVAVEIKVMIEIDSIADFAKIHANPVFQKARHHTGISNYCVSDKEKAKCGGDETIQKYFHHIVFVGRQVVQLNIV